MTASKKDAARNTLARLGRDVAIEVITDYLVEHAVPYKLWQPDDIRSLIPDEAPDERIIDLAQESGYWRDLADCTDHDWDLVSLAIDDAVAQIEGENK